MPILSMEEKQSILSKQERDRRWKNIRESMAKQELDCLLVYGSFGRYGHLNASLRYLTNMNTEGFLVFPDDGDPMITTFMGGSPTPWININRVGHPLYSNVVSDMLKDLHMEKARIGFAELSGYNGEQGFPHTAYAALIKNFPKAKFADATAILNEARLIKSQAEIKCLELGSEAGEKAIQVIVDTARPGIKDYEVRSRFRDTLFREGCDIDSMILYYAGKELIHGAKSGRIWSATQKVMEDGDIIHTEFDATFMGYVAQFNQPFSLGDPGKEWLDIFKIQVESVNRGLGIVKAGITVGELNDAMAEPILKAGYRQRTPNFHGLGLAIEEPFSAFPGQPAYRTKRDHVLKPNMVLEFEPSIISPDYRRGSTLGCPVLITETGYRLLAKNWKPEVKIITMT